MIKNQQAGDSGLALVEIPPHEDLLDRVVTHADFLMNRYGFAKLKIKVGEVELDCHTTTTTATTTTTDTMITRPTGPVVSSSLTDIKSDSVGTIYLATSPNDTPYIMIGTRIEPGQTLFIIEAMKVMNHFKSPCGGIVKEILVRNEQVVEYGQVLARVE